MLIRTLYLLRLGFDTAYLGSYLATGALAYMGMGIPSGTMGSRFGTKNIMRIGGLISLLGMGMLPLTEMVPISLRASWPYVGQLVQISGWSMVNVNLVPALMGTTSTWNRHSSYALASGLRELGSFLGSLVGGLLPGIFGLFSGASLDDPGPYRSALWVSIVTWVIALIPIFLIRSGGTASRQKDQPVKGTLPILPIALMFLYVYIRQASWASCQSFCNPYMDQALRYSSATIGTITAFGQIVAIGASLLLPSLLKKRNAGWMLITATVGLGISLLLLALSSHWVVVTLGRLGVLVTMAMWLPTLQVYQMEIVEESSRGIVYGAMSMAMGLGFATMSYTGGFVIESYGYGAIFIVGACISGVAVIIMMGIQNKHQKTLPT